MPDSAFTPEKVFYPYFQSVYNQQQKTMKQLIERNKNDAILYK